jgi:hypothetical protein
MATEQQKQYFADLLKIQFQVAEKAKTDKQKLVGIALEDSSATVRLNKLRRLILESQIPKEEPQVVEEENTTSSSTTGSLTEPVLSMNELAPKIMNLDTNELNLFSRTMRMTFDPALAQKELMGKIADVIRQSDLTDDVKIVQISDLLM